MPIFFLIYHSLSFFSSRLCSLLLFLPPFPPISNIFFLPQSFFHLDLFLPHLFLSFVFFSFHLIVLIFFVLKREIQFHLLVQITTDPFFFSCFKFKIRNCRIFFFWCLLIFQNVFGSIFQLASGLEASISEPNSKW